MKTFCRRGLLLLPILLLVVGINIAVDPGNLIHDVERVVAQALLDGRHVVHARDMDDRLMQKLVVEGRRQAAEVVVVGSSRSMEIRADFFPGRTFFNSSVSSGGMRDYLALYEAYRARGFKPSLLVVGVDPWILNEAFETSRWRTLQGDYNRIAQRLGLPQDRVRARNRSRLNRWTQLASPSYFQASLRSLFRQDERPRATDDPFHPSQMILKDGSLKYPKDVMDKTPEEVRRAALDFPRSRAAAALVNFDRLFEEAQTGFRIFLRSLQEEKTDLLLFLPPYHPEVWRELRTNPAYARVLETEAWLRRLAQDLNVPVAGSYDPTALGCGEADFYDAIHVKGAAIRPLFLQRPGK